MSEFKVGDRVRVKPDQTHLASDWPGYEGRLIAPDPEWGDQYKFNWGVVGTRGPVAVYDSEIEHVDD